MLNARLYRISWLIAGAALIVALLTLRPASGSAPDPVLPPTFDGRSALALAGELALRAPERPPGSEGDVVAADWVQRMLAAVPGGRGRVGRQDFVVRSGGQTYHLRNVYMAVPAAPGSSLGSSVVVVAPRDTPAGVTGGTSGTAILVELARLSATTTLQHPLLVVSTDGSTLGNAGIRWFLHRFSGTAIAGAIVLDAPGEATGTKVSIWSFGRSRGRSLAMVRLAEHAIERAGGRPDGHERLLTQLLRLGVPQTFGDQGALVAAGVPAVTLAGRSDAPLRTGPPPTEARMAMVGNAAETLLGSLDAGDRVAGPTTALQLTGKVLWPGAARVLLLLLALPLLVSAVDVLARLRRARVPLVPGLRAVAWRAAPPLAGLIAAQLLVIAGALPGAAVGAPPLPDAVPFDALAGLSIALVAVAALAAWKLAGVRRQRLAATPSGEAVAALVALSALVLALWWTHPYTLALVLPIAHAGLLATAAPRRWHLGALAALALAPLAALTLLTAGQLDRNPLFAAWYLLVTAVDGARSIPGAVASILIAACVWSLARFVIFRARKGLVKGRAAPAQPAPAAKD
ncbi:MAG: hypothetical protein QOK40_2064 [Miltoncostaeaceae bacterium]|jgi:hypothetical protein|nr:hypothetical protein [Miltoncostaeaceae bacterium]